MKVFNLMALLTVINFSHAQNLVPNPDFETVSSAFCGIASAGDFDNSFDQWISASNSTPDPYFNNINQSCFNFQPNSTYSGPIGIKGSQLPRSGNAMAGGYMYTISMLQQRDYIQVPLTSPLTIGGLYLVEFYVSLADSTEFATSNIGGLLSTSAIFQPGDGVYIASPQIEATSVISDDQSWTRIIDTITATDAFAHLTIGNFYDDNSTTLVAHPTNSGAPCKRNYCQDAHLEDKIFFFISNMEQCSLSLNYYGIQECFSRANMVVSLKTNVKNTIQM